MSKRGVQACPHITAGRSRCLAGCSRARQASRLGGIQVGATADWYRPGIFAWADTALAREQPLMMHSRDPLQPRCSAKAHGLGSVAITIGRDWKSRSVHFLILSCLAPRNYSSMTPGVRDVGFFDYWHISCYRRRVILCTLRPLYPEAAVLPTASQPESIDSPPRDQQHARRPPDIRFQSRFELHGAESRN